MAMSSTVYIGYDVKAVLRTFWTSPVSRMLGAFSVPSPPPPEQAAIVRFLDHADRRIRRYIRAKEKLIALLEEQKQAIIHQAVTGKIDVRTGQPYPAYKAFRRSSGWVTYLSIGRCGTEDTCAISLPESPESMVTDGGTERGNRDDLCIWIQLLR